MDLGPLEGITWSARTHSLRDIALCADITGTNVNQTLPLIVKITSGFYGNKEEDSLAIDQIVLFESTGEETCLLARNEDDCCLSIPTNYPQCFEIAAGKASTKLQTLKQIIAKNTLPVRVRFDPNTYTSFTVANIQRNSKEFGTLTLESTHVVEYIKGRPVYVEDGDVHHDQTMYIPNYRDIRFRIAEGPELLIQGLIKVKKSRQRQSLLQTLSIVGYDDTDFTDDEYVTVGLTKRLASLSDETTSSSSIEQHSKKESADSDRHISDESPDSDRHLSPTEQHFRRDCSKESKPAVNPMTRSRTSVKESARTLEHFLQVKAPPGLCRKPTPLRELVDAGSLHSAGREGRSLMNSLTSGGAMATATSHHHHHHHGDQPPGGPPRRSSSKSSTTPPATHWRDPLPLPTAASTSGSSSSPLSAGSAFHPPPVFGRCNTPPRSGSVNSNRFSTDSNSSNDSNTCSNGTGGGREGGGAGSPCGCSSPILTSPRRRKGSAAGGGGGGSFIVTLEEVPEDLSELSVSGVCDCLRLLHLETHVVRFQEDQIDGALLAACTADDLREMGLSAFSAKKLTMFIGGWRPKMV